MYICTLMCICACWKLLNLFTTLLFFPYFFATQSIEYHRLRQARGEGHDTHQTKKVERRNFAHLCFAFTLIQCHSMYITWLTACFGRVSYLIYICIYTYMYTRSVLSFKEDLCARNRTRTLERKSERERKTLVRTMGRADCATVHCTSTKTAVAYRWRKWRTLSSATIEYQ